MCECKILTQVNYTMYYVPIILYVLCTQLYLTCINILHSHILLIIDKSHDANSQTRMGWHSGAVVNSQIERSDLSR